MSGAPHVEATVAAFIVMVTSIGVDVSRSRALARAARKYRSQALEADALHFSTDVWSSLVVLARAHEIADRAEAAVRKAVEGIDVVVHPEPARNGPSVHLDASGRMK